MCICYIVISHALFQRSFCIFLCVHIFLIWYYAYLIEIQNMLDNNLLTISHTILACGLRHILRPLPAPYSTSAELNTRSKEETELLSRSPGHFVTFTMSTGTWWCSTLISQRKFYPRATVMLSAICVHLRIKGDWIYQISTCKGLSLVPVYSLYKWMTFRIPAKHLDSFSMRMIQIHSVLLNTQSLSVAQKQTDC